MANPVGLSYAKVVGLYQMFMADNVDSDDLPDFVGLEGTGTITPNLLEAHNINPGLTSIYLPDPIEVSVVNGVLTQGSTPYVMLLAPSAGVTPQAFNYSIKLSLRPTGTDYEFIAYGPFTFDPIPDPVTGVVDLALATPVAASAGEPMIAGAPGPAGDMQLVLGPASVSGTVTLGSADLPSTRLWTLTGNTTLNLPTPGSSRSGTITLVLTQDGTGNRTLTIPGVKWPDGIAQGPAAAAGTISVIHLLWTGSAWLGLVGGKSFA